MLGAMQTSTTPTTDAASHSAPPAAIITHRAGLFGSVSLQPMLRGPMVTWASDVGYVGDTGPISMDDAVSLLTAEPDDGADDGDDGDDGGDDDADADEDAEDGDPEAEGDEDDEAPDQGADEDDAPEDEPASDDEPVEGEEDEPAEPVTAAPQFWSAEEKALFAKAPPEVQLLIAAKDQAAEKRVYEAKEEAAVARKAASVISDFKSVIDQQVERAQTIFQGRWDGIDWAAWAKEDAQEALAAKFEFDEEQKELERLRTVAAATEVEEHRTFLRDEAAKLREANHVLADPVKGKAEKQRLVAYAETAGFHPSDLKWAGSKELTTLHKAMLYDELQAKVAKDPPKPTPKPTPAPAKAAAPKPAGSLRPGAPPPPRKSVVTRQRQDVVRKAMNTGRMDDAVDALLAIEGKKR